MRCITFSWRGDAKRTLVWNTLNIFREFLVFQSEFCEQISFSILRLVLSALDRGWDWFHTHMPWHQHGSKAKSDFYWHISFLFWKKLAHACPLLKYLRYFLQACQCKLSCFDGNLISTRCSLKYQHLEIVAIKTIQNHFPHCSASHMHKSKVNAIWNQMLSLVSSP